MAYNILVTQTPEFEGPLRNPDVSEEADREWDKAAERMSAQAARRIIPEFAKLEQPSSPVEGTQVTVQRITAAEERLPYAQAILENANASRRERLARQAQEEAANHDESLQALRETFPKPEGSGTDGGQTTEQT